MVDIVVVQILKLAVNMFGRVLCDELRRKLERRYRRLRCFPTSSSRRTVIRRDRAGLTRVRVRHVVFRLETIRLMVSTCDGTKLAKTAETIGRSAAEDLWESVKRGVWRRWPIDGGELVELLSYWDKTGGWGEYTTTRRDDAHWTISIEGGFIERKNGKDFWEGYFRGFCGRCAELSTDSDLATAKLVKAIECDFDQTETLVCEIEWQT